MEALKKTLTYFMPEKKADENRRRHTRLSGDGMTVIAGGARFDVVNWSENGFLLKAGNTNLPVTAQELTLKLKFSTGDGTKELPRTGRIIRRNGDYLAVSLMPLNEDEKILFGRMVDRALTESFVRSQLV
ncbi:MAG: hypothetical protein EA357_02970 [Micavibrio sp.]|nr:MAG: hypothetical protein EA357_02970 [Micavibrio sp.]